MSAPPPTARLLRAAAAERVELGRHRERLEREAHDLRAALAQIEHGLAEIDERGRLLDRLAPPAAAPGSAALGSAAPASAALGSAAPGSAAPASAAPGSAAPASAAAGSAAPGALAAHGSAAPRASAVAGARATLLRGPAIRETAVRMLARRGAGEALHYREWFALLAADGYEIAGKDPVAVFLTQISRSPAVRRGTRAGVYELDRQAPGRLFAMLEVLQGELRELAAVAGASAADLGAIRVRRAQLTTEIGRAERALEEIGRTLEPVPALAATA